MSELSDAEKAVCKAIAKKAGLSPNAVTSEDLERLAHAVAHMKFGPQGGEVTRSDDYRYSADYHYTEHDRDRGPRTTGFGAWASHARDPEPPERSSHGDG